VKYLFILIFLSSLCFGTLQTDIGVSNYDSYHIYDYFSFSIVRPSSEIYFNSFHSNPIIFYPQRYINDLGQEFPIEFFVCGTYWKGGSWGSRNGFNQYYGNVYFHNYSSYTPKIYNNNVPEPSSIILFSGFLFFFEKVLKSGKKNNRII